MRAYGMRTRLPPDAGGGPSDWRTLVRLLPYLWHHRWRTGVVRVLVAAAKVSNGGVPLLLQVRVDRMNATTGDTAALVVVSVALLLACGAPRLTDGGGRARPEALRR